VKKAISGRNSSTSKIIHNEKWSFSTKIGRIYYYYNQKLIFFAQTSKK